MKIDAQVIYLADYQVPDFVIVTTDLDIRIGDEYTSVVARLKMQRNPQSSNPSAPLVLFGGKDIKLQEVLLDEELLKSH